MPLANPQWSFFWTTLTELDLERRKFYVVRIVSNDYEHIQPGLHSGTE